MPKKTHNSCEHQLRWEGHGEDDDHPPPDELRPYAESNVQGAEEGNQTVVDLVCFL